VRGFLADDPFRPTKAGTFVRYFMLVAKNAAGEICGVRDGCVLFNQGYGSDQCVIFLARLFMLPAARGTALSLWLRIAPVEIAMQHLADLHDRCLITLPLPDAPEAYFGLRLNLTAEMEYFAQQDRASLARILFYGRGGFRAISPGHVPYAQPDMRPAAQIHATGARPVPLMILVRRIGREQEATMPIDEARVMLQLLYDDFVCQCAPEHLEGNLALVLRRLEHRAQTEDHVELLPLPTGRGNVDRLRALFRTDVLLNHYTDYAETISLEAMSPASSPLDEELSEIARELAARSRRHVYRRRNPRLRR